LAPGLKKVFQYVNENAKRVKNLNAVEFSKSLSWMAQTKVITLKMQLHLVNAR